MKNVKTWVMGLVMLLAVGCGSIAEEYVAADRLTYEALKPKLDGLHDDRVDRVVISWKERIEAAEAGRFKAEKEVE